MNGHQEKGLAPYSQRYVITPSRRAQAVLYYLYHAGHYYCDTHYIVKRDFFPSFLLLYVISGEMEVSGSDYTVRVNSGEMAFLDCHHPHCYRALKTTDYIWLHFDGANTEAFYREILHVHGSLLHFDNMEYFQKQIQINLDQLKTVGRIDEVIMSRRIHDLLCSILYPAHQMESSHPVIAAAQQYLNDHLADPLSVSQLAGFVHLSESQCNRLFRLYTGQSPHEYLINLRMNRAKILLKETQNSITEIAAEVGYGYDTSFAAAFRSRTGMSPRQFRKMPI